MITPSISLAADCCRTTPAAECAVLLGERMFANHKVRFAETLCSHRHVDGRKDRQGLARPSLLVASNERRHSPEPRYA